MSAPYPETIPRSFETKRLMLRCPVPEDAPTWHTAVIESLPQLRPWLAQYENTPTLADSWAELLDRQAKFATGRLLSWLLFLKGTNTLVGSADLFNIDQSLSQLEIGYWARTTYSRQGYITEAVGGLVEFAFQVLRITRLVIRCDSLNERSVAIPLRLGFTQEAVLFYDMWNNFAGEPRDTIIFTKVKTRP